MAQYLVPQQRDHVADDAVDVHRRLLRLGFRRELADPLNDLPGPVAVLRDAVEGAANPLEVGIRRGQPVQRRVGIGDDGGQRLIDLVSDRRDQLPQRGDTGHVRELHLRVAVSLLAVAQFLLGPLALGDVPGDAAVAGKPVLGIEHRLATDGHEAKGAVGASDLVDEVAERLATLDGGDVLTPLFRR